MNYPKLVFKKACNVPVKVYLESEGLNEDGGSEVIFEKDLYCNYQGTAKTVYTADKKAIQLSGVALFHEDFCPSIPTIAGGTVIIFGEKRTILQAIKARNPDGTVNYIELRLV